MMYESPKARAYEQAVPGTGVSEAQAEERWERREFKNERRSDRRTGRNRGIVVPDCAYFRNKEGA